MVLPFDAQDHGSESTAMTGMRLTWHAGLCQCFRYWGIQDCTNGADRGKQGADSARGARRYQLFARAASGLTGD